MTFFLKGILKLSGYVKLSDPFFKGRGIEVSIIYVETLCKVKAGLKLKSGHYCKSNPSACHKQGTPEINKIYETRVKIYHHPMLTYETDVLILAMT